MSLIRRSLSAIGKIGIVIGIAVAFLFGLTSTVYLSLRSSTVKVPDVVGKDRLTAENALQDSGLNIRVRATRPTSDAKPDTVLMQVPRAGEMVKEGQTVAVDISRVPKEGEQSISLPSAENKNAEEKKPDEGQQAENSNAKESTQKNDNQNANQNQNKAKRNKNTNSNSNSNANNRNANNSTNSNGNSAANANRANANNRNANQSGQNRNANTGNHNANANVNRNSNNTNRRAPANTATQPATTPGNRRTP